MSTLGNITVYDGASTPVAHTLVGISVSTVNGETVAVYREQLTSLPVYAQVSLTLKIKKLPSGVYRVASRAEVPVMESVSGQNAAGYTAAPKVAYVDTVESVGYFHERSSIANHRIARQLSTNIMGGISTSIAVVTTGPIAELFDMLAPPT